jgi:hypothetical protein
MAVEPYALFATLTQQWAGTQIPPISPNAERSVPRECARVRSFLFVGTLKYHMLQRAETAPTLLHLSVYLRQVGTTYIVKET